MIDTKFRTRQLLSLLLALTLVFGLIPASAVAADTAGEAEGAVAAAATFKNTTNDGGDDVISLTLARTFEARIPTSVYVTDPDAVVWTLVRDTSKSYASADLFPNQKMEAELSQWKTSNNKNGLFTAVTSSETDEDGQNWLVLDLEVAQYFATAPHANGGSYLDNCGYFDLEATLDGKDVGSVGVKIVPYDTFHTMAEVYEEIDNMVAFAKENTDLYVKKAIMGQSSGVVYDPLDIPYLIVAKDQSVVTDWLAFTEKAETNPTQVLADIQAGKYDDIKVPVMFSNIHSNEVAAVDGIIEFAWMLLENAANKSAIPYDVLTGFTAKGEEQFEVEKASRRMVEPDLIKKDATWLGWLQVGNGRSGVVDLDTYYEVDTKTVTVDSLLEDVFFILVPEENVEGRTYVTRTASNGYDLNRDNSFQTTPETQAMQKLIGTFNPVSLTEFHGQVSSFQCEPCDPPHEPNFEYDLLAQHLMKGGEALGIAAVANNEAHNSYVIPQRDYLIYPKGGSAADAAWDVWDDMSTSYTPQFAMLHGTVAYTVELPSYTDAGAHLVQYGCLGQSHYIAGEKLGYLTAQTKIYERGVTNFNSDAYELVGQWFADQYDVEGAEMDLFRPEYAENGNFYPECYIIPMDGANQSNLQAAYDMMEWLSRNDVKILVTTKVFTYGGVTYPAGTMIIDMYQAKRSVANSALYNGTLIQSWSELYSEGITAFNKTRGFDMVTVADPKAYTGIKSACGSFMDYDNCVAYLKEQGSYFTGVKGSHVVISNASEDSTAAVNALLKAGSQVGMVTDEKSEYYGDFICSYADWQTVSSKYVLSGTGLAQKDLPKALVISKAPTVYITGASNPNASGFVWTSRVGNASWNYDRVAMDIMNFATTDDVSKADVVLGASSLSGDALAAVQAGTPYIGYGSGAHGRNSWATTLATRSSVSGAMDCLGYVTYPNTTLVNASYVMDGDDILYGYGVGYYTAIPEGATVLVKMDKSKTPLEGFIPTTSDALKASYAQFMDSVQGFAYQGADKDGNQVNMALFANSLTHKGHQRDEYAFISNFIFSNLLDEKQVYGVDTSSDDDGDDDDSSSSSSSGSTSSGSSSGSTSSGAASSSTKTDKDGTVTETTTTADGTKTETVTKPDGTVTETVTKADGTKTETVANPDGSGSKTVTKADGAKSEAVTTADGDVTVTATDANGEVIAKVELPATVPALEEKFEDVPAGHWAESAINTMAALNVVKGVSAQGHVFDMTSNITRGTMAQILFNLSNGKEGKAVSFSDVAKGAWYADAVAWAADSGVVTGYADGNFGPNDTITREQLAVMLYRYADLLGLDLAAKADLGQFTDGATVSTWASDAMAWAVSNGLIQGKGANNLDPSASASRAETAVVLQRFLSLVK